MKTRTGFVSNSSSCSFIAIAVKGPDLSDSDKIKLMRDNQFDLNDYIIFDDEGPTDENIDIKGAWYEYINHIHGDLSIFSGSEDGVPDGEEWYGETIIRTDDCGYMDERQYSIEEILEIGNAIKEKLKIDGEVKLITGTRVS